MGVLSLTVVSDEKGIKKTMQFEPTTLVFDAAKLIRDKFGMHDTNPNEYGLFRIEDEPSKCAWMENGRTLEYYLVRNQDRIEYKKKIRLLKVRMLDNAVKTVPIDESQPVSQLMLAICNKIGISNYEEYSLVREDVTQNGHGRFNNENNGSTWTLREERNKSMERGGMMGTLGRKKEQKLEELRHKLHTDEELKWLDHAKTLREQNVAEDETLLLRRKFFFSDTNVDSRDPVQLNLLYVQCRDGVLRGLHPVQRETALQLGALQAHIQYGDFPYDKPKFHLDGRDLLPKEYAKNKENEKKIVQYYKELTGTNELDAKSKYVHLCRELKTYGVTFFVVKEKMAGKNRLVPRLLGVNKESVMRVDEKTKEILKEWPLEQVRRWASSGRTFNLDFGDYQDGYYSVQTADGEKIGQLIGGYIDIILKKKRTRDHQGIEGDEGSTMLEDVVAPAKATLVAHGQIGTGQHAQDGLVAVKGVLRTPHGGYGYGINGAQYGAVSGEVTSHSVGKAQRIRIRDTYEQPQRALIGTIEATIRAVEVAQDELEREPEIELPKFADNSAANRWIDEQVAVNKESVNERLAAMGAATAQVVQWTAVQEEQDEVDERVGTAIATIASNLPDVSKNVRNLAFLEENTRGDLVEATRNLCGAFGEFLEVVNPEKEEKRTKVFTAAGHVGDFSQHVLNTMEAPTERQRTYNENLVQKAKNVATSTAQLVLCAKTISAETEEPELQEKVVHSATQCAFATSQLVACARVVAPTIENQACQQQLTSAATRVSHAVTDLLYDADQTRTDKRTLTSIHEAARQVTGALDRLLEHAKTSPKTETRKEEEEEYNQVIRRSNKMIVHQGPSEDLTREAKKVIRHSTILMEQFEHEASQRPEQRDKLLDAARKVARATSDMAEAARECESRPSEADAEFALRNAAEKLAAVASETTTEQQEKHIMQRLEQAAKQTAYDATQTIAASNAAKETITTRTVSDLLVYECTQTAEHVPKLISSIRESQQAETSSAKFRAQSRLIRDAHNVLTPSIRLVDSARSSVGSVNEVHLASNLAETSNRLATTLAELRTALSDAQQLNFSQQLVHSEELIRELDQQLVATQQQAQAGTLPPSRTDSRTATSHLMSTARHVGSGVAQLISSVPAEDEKHIGASAVELASNLRDFTESIVEVVSTRQDIQLDKLVIVARSVVHDTGRVFDRVRERASPLVLADTAKEVSTDLKKVIACIPDNEHVEKAIYRIQTAHTSSDVRAPDLKTAANRVLEATSQLLVTISQPDNAKAVDVFVNAYVDLHGSAIAAVRTNTRAESRTSAVDQLETTQREAIGVLGAVSRASVITDTTHLSNQSRQFTSSVNRLVELVGSEQEQPWQRECDAALRQIASVRHLTEQATIPLSDDSYFGSLDKVTEQSRRLGEAMTGIARNAKAMDTESLCTSVRHSAEAVCQLAEAASHSGYLVGVSHPESVPGKAALLDTNAIARSVDVVKQECKEIESGKLGMDAVIKSTGEIAKQTSAIAHICKIASHQTTNVNVKKHLTNSAKELADKTAAFIHSVKTLGKNNSEESFNETLRCSRELGQVGDQLQIFVDNPDFAAVPATISDVGRSSQTPILKSSRSMLDSSSEMIRTAKDLASSPKDAATWQRLADNSKHVSESIKMLVSSIRDAAPGQIELERAIVKLQQIIATVDRTAMDAYADAAGVVQNSTAERQVHQQIQHLSHALEENVNSLRTAAVSVAENLPHNVTLHVEMTEHLAAAACRAATLAVDSRQKSELFDRCRTVVEAELQMMAACRDSAGNPNAVHAHSIVDEAAMQLKHAIGEMRSTIAQIGNDHGVVQGMVDTISTSIAATDLQSPAQGTFVDAQTRMTQNLEEIRNLAQIMPTADAKSLGVQSLTMSEKYHMVADDARQAVGLIPSVDVAQKFKVEVQKLGNACIEAVKAAGQKRAHPADERIHRELTTKTLVVIEKVEQVLASLHEASRGTQACISAANTVSGIIGDLDTTILFATSGTWNYSNGDQQKAFSVHRDAILKTAKALVEDTKALVTGAASNQEQLAVAAQNAVKTIVLLSDTVKNGAISLTSENSEGQVLVIHAVRDVASALSSLIQATKNASGRSVKHPGMEQLKEAAKVMVSNITIMLKTVKSVENAHNQGSAALEAAIEAVTYEIRQYNSSEGTSSFGRVENLPLAVENVSQATQALAAAGESHEQVTHAANLARSAVRELLAVSRAAANEADAGEARYQIVDAGRDTANQVKDLLIYLHGQMTRDPKDEKDYKSLIVETSRRVSKALSALIGSCEFVKDVHDDQMEEAVLAENELLGAASSIAAASVKLAELRPRVPVAQTETDQTDGFDEQILSSAKSITAAVQTLVRAASNAQRELIAQGRFDTSRQAGTDYQWSEGLISAAKVVVAAVHQLCEAANGLVQGVASEEKLVSAAKQVASSTAHLLVACNVKADMDSKAKKRLQVAGQQVKAATERLVETARQNVVRDDRKIVISKSLVSGIAQVMDAHEEVLRKEIELNKARETLSTLNKKRYERDGSQ